MPFIEQLLNGENVEWKKLGEVCEIKTGKGVTKKNAISNGVYPIISGGKKPMDYINIHNREANTVTVSRVGANAGYVNYHYCPRNSFNIKKSNKLTVTHQN